MSLASDGKSEPEEKDQKREVAYTPIGRNLLFIGLLTHLGALFLAMTGLPGIDSHLYFLYISFWLLLIVGLYTELLDRGYRPARDYRFYLLALLAIYPVVGPLTTFMALYLLAGPGKKAPFSISGMIGSFFRLRASGSFLLLTLLLLFALFAFIYSTHDPYFKRVRGKRVSSTGWIAAGIRSQRESTDSTSHFPS